LSHIDVVTGLDIGTTKVCAVIAELTEGEQPNVIGVGISSCAGLKKGIVVEMESTIASIRDAIGKAERMAGEHVQSVVVGVTGEHIACLNSRSVIAINHPGREIVESDLDRLMENAKNIVLPPEREIIHAIPRWYSIDGQKGMSSPVGMHGNRVEMETHIVTGLSSFIQNVVKCVHEAGLTVDATVLEPIAAGESVLTDAEKDLGVAVVDIGGGTSDLAIYVDGEVTYSAAVPIGGTHVTKDIAIGLRADPDEAERAKIGYGHATLPEEQEMDGFSVTGLGSAKTRTLPKKVLVEIIEPRMSELCSLVMDKIDDFGGDSTLPAGIVFTGGGSQIRGLAELATSISGLPARVGSPNGLTGLIESISSPSYSTAVGLVLFWNKYHFERESYGGEGLLSGLVRRIRELFAKLTGH
jgi:cell division protein FtsA